MLNDETKKTRNMFLNEAENGGWMLSGDPGRPGVFAPTLAAFSSSADLIEGLADMLDIDVTVWPSDQDVAEAECIRAAAAGMMGADPQPPSEPAQADSGDRLDLLPEEPSKWMLTQISEGMESGRAGEIYRRLRNAVMRNCAPMPKWVRDGAQEAMSTGSFTHGECGANGAAIGIARTAVGSVAASIPKGAMILDHRINGDSATILYRT